MPRPNAMNFKATIACAMIKVGYQIVERYYLEFAQRLFVKVALFGNLCLSDILA